MSRAQRRALRKAIGNKLHQESVKGDWNRVTKQESYAKNFENIDMSDDGKDDSVDGEPIKMPETEYEKWLRKQK